MGEDDGQAETTHTSAYQVLARKYRPSNFSDLIGQEAMVRTLTHAFATGRIAHAFMLTGVRGVGKTTTARILARAFNFETDENKKPDIALDREGQHCRAIIEGRHMDVLELDAASRTKVDEMRELLDGVRYAPVSARYKVYVIDEVHMLSTQSFNALLKTLEEPPSHVKFIFATTEIRKVPVTILSRCQRFDLRRVETEVLIKHLEAIASKEGAFVERSGLAYIARAAEGSVRDALSLLDQAIIQADRGQIISADNIRLMLGMADHNDILELFKHVLTGDIAKAIQNFRRLYSFGADPSIIFNSLLEQTHAVSLGKTLGSEALDLPTDQSEKLIALGIETSAANLSRLWQMLLKACEEIRRAPDPAMAAEMALIRLAYSAHLPGPEAAITYLQSHPALSSEQALAFVSDNPKTLAHPPNAASSHASHHPGSGAVAAPNPQSQSQKTSVAFTEKPDPALASQTPPLPEPNPDGVLNNFEALIALVEQQKDVNLLFDLKRFVRLVDFREGFISFEPTPETPKDLQHRLVKFLKDWTGKAWVVEQIENPPDQEARDQKELETLDEKEKREEAEAREKLKDHPMVKAVLAHFPGADISAHTKTTISETALTSDTSIEDDQSN